MNFKAYRDLPPEEQAEYQSQRTCPECKAHLVAVNGHSTGDLHTMCPICENCPDCEEGE